MMARARTIRTRRAIALLCLLGSLPGSKNCAAQALATSEESSPRKASAESARADSGEAAMILQKEKRKERMNLVTRFAEDQRRLWTSPERVRFSDAEWLIPAGGFAAALLVTDRDASLHLSRNPKTIHRYNTISNAGAGALIGSASGLWLLGHVRHDSHWSESGFLAGEAALNSLVMVEGLKYSLGRQRPFQGNGSGAFFQGGTSFPSEHAAAAWAVAGVLAHEYPGPLTKVLAYGLAGAVSYSRVRGRQHFPSDVFVGGMMGNLVAQEIYARHHDTELGGAAWRSLGEIVRGDGGNSPSRSGSPYVPLDSWVYPTLDRLAALGVIHNEFLGMRPWTRLECARLVEEAEDGLAEGTLDVAVGSSSLGMLATEFAKEKEVLAGGSNREMKLESVYTRGMQISGPPLADSAHFGQTVINDFGRPYQQGFNNATGFSGHAAEGKYTVYVRGCQSGSVGATHGRGRAVPAGGSLRWRERRELAAHFREAKPLLGARGRRAAAFQQQRGTHLHVSRQPHRAVAASVGAPVSWPGEVRRLLRPTGGKRISSAPADSRRENQLQTNTKPGTR